jgi:hypothetical protein
MNFRKRMVTEARHLSLNMVRDGRPDKPEQPN